MKPTITAFKDSPDQGEGQARDMRVRWALEEVGQPYDVRLLTFEELKAPPHRAIHPFGKIPTYEEGDLTLFESGAILLHIAEHHPGLLPKDPDARMRAIMWVFAALNTLEPPIVERESFEVMEKEQDWYEERLPILEDRIRDRLGELAAFLGGADWLEGEFNLGDMMMVMVLRRMNGWGLLEEFPTLADYVARGEARPAFKRAFDAQRAVFEESQASAKADADADA